MHAVGIIAEYNPFHNGHAYHLSCAKRLSGCTHAIVAMSGSFVQRGDTAAFDKFARARWALCHGADLVLELPTAFACASAERFARGGVALLAGTGLILSLIHILHHGRAERLCIRTAMRLDDPAVYAKQRRAAMFGIVHLLFHPPERGLCKQCAKLCPRVCHKFFLKHGKDRCGKALRVFEHHIACLLYTSRCV